MLSLSTAVGTSPNAQSPRRSLFLFCTLHLVLWAVPFLVVHFFEVSSAYAADEGQPRMLLHETFDSLAAVQSHGGKVIGGRFAEGKDGNAFFSQNAQEYVTIPTKNHLNIPAGTIELWVMLPEGMRSKSELATVLDCLGTPHWYSRIIMQLGDVMRNSSLILRGNVVSDRRADVYADNYVDVPMAPKWRPGTWHHLALSWDKVNSGAGNGVVRLYVDGAEVGVSDNQRDIRLSKSPDRFYVGAMDPRCPEKRRRKIPLAIDELKIWDRPVVPDPAALGFTKVSLLKEQPLVTAPRSGGSRTPTIDGRLNAGEWDKAPVLTYFHDYRDFNDVLARKQTIARVTYDDRNLCFAWECETLGEKVVGEIRERDGRVYDDDSVEILIAPAGLDPKPTAVFHFIGNAWASVYDERSVGRGPGDSRWNGDWVFRVSRSKSHWQGELSIPFAGLGTKPPAPGDAWRINVCRNSRNPKMGDAQISSWARCHSPKPFIDVSGMGTLVFGRDEARVTALPMMDFLVGRNPAKARLYGGYADGAHCKWRVAIGEGQSPPRLLEVERRIAKGIFTLIKFAAPASTQALRQARYDLIDADTDKVLWRQTFGFNPQPPLKVETVTWFPLGYVEVNIDVRRMSVRPANVSARVLSSDGSAAAPELVSPLRNGLAHVKVPTKALKVGEKYRLTITAHAPGGEALARRHIPLCVHGPPDCIDPTAGVSNKVLPPWTPMTAERKQVTCWGRTYDFSQGFLPNAIHTRGQQVLAAPVSITCEVAGRRVSWQRDQITFSEIAPNRAVMTGAHGSPLLAADAKVTGEYDGVFRFDLTLRPKRPLKVDSLTLCIPVKANHARYLQFNNGILRESGFAIVRGHGWQWKRRFMPLLWLGDDERGLCWFAESYQAWRPYDRPDTVVVRREKDVVYLDLNILKNVTLSDPLSLTFGLQATPVKPVPKDRRAVRVFMYRGGPVNEGRPLEYRLPVSPQELAKQGIGTVVFSTYWAEHSCVPRPFHRSAFKKIVEKLHAQGLSVLVYFNLLPGVKSPEANYYGRLWWRLPLLVDPPTKRPGYRERMYATSCCYSGPDYADYLAGGVKKLIEDFGIDGVYFDNGLNYCRNPLHGCGYSVGSAEAAQKIEIGSEDMRGVKTTASAMDEAVRLRRRTYCIFQARELHKRLYSLFKTMRPDSHLIIHMSNYMTSPIHSFFDSTLDGEHLVGKPKGWMPTPEQFRAQHLREQFGLDAFWLVYEGPSRPYTKEEALAFTLIHGQWPYANEHDIRAGLLTKAWTALDRFQVQNATWLPYWKNSELVKASANDAYVSAYVRDGEALLLISRIPNPGKKTVHIALDVMGLGLKTDLRATDAWSGQSLAYEGNTLTLELTGRRARMVYLLR